MPLSLVGFRPSMRSLWLDNRLVSVLLTCLFGERQFRSIIMQNGNEPVLSTKTSVIQGQKQLRHCPKSNLVFQACFAVFPVFILGFQCCKCDSHVTACFNIDFGEREELLAINDKRCFFFLFREHSIS